MTHSQSAIQDGRDPARVSEGRDADSRGDRDGSSVLFAASDVQMRDFFLVIPEDCPAARTPEDHEGALELMRDKLDARTTPSAEMDVTGCWSGGRGNAGHKNAATSSRTQYYGSIADM